MSKIFPISAVLLSILMIRVSCNVPTGNEGLKIVSLSPAMTEIIFALGAGRNLAGVTTFCDYPDSAKSLYKVGDFSHPSLERIIGLKPDLVIVNLPEQTRIKQDLERLKIKVYPSSPHSLADIYTEIKAIGHILDREKAADSLVAYMQTNLRPSPSSVPKRVYIELSPGPIVTVGARSFLNELLAMAGAENIFEDLDREYPVIRQEEIIKRDPEIIILLHPASIAGRMGWKKITACRDNKIYQGLDQDQLLRPGPRLVDGLQRLKKVINE